MPTAISKYVHVVLLTPYRHSLNATTCQQLCDFGLARSARPPPDVANDSSTFMTEYVATRWYRAPEVMLTFKEYTRAIDMWSVGCVLAEMLSGKPLFPGRDCTAFFSSFHLLAMTDHLFLSTDHHQLSIILDILGTPSIDDFYAITSQRSREYIRALPFRKKKSFHQLFPKANPLAIDLMEKCLTFSPKRRIEVGEALKHPYLAVSWPLHLSDVLFFLWSLVPRRSFCLAWLRRRVVQSVTEPPVVPGPAGRIGRCLVTHFFSHFIFPCKSHGSAHDDRHCIRCPSYLGSFVNDLLILLSQPYHDPQDEPTAEPIDPQFFHFDNGDPMKKEDLKVLIYQEITRPDPPQSTFLLSNNPTANGMTL